MNTTERKLVTQENRLSTNPNQNIIKKSLGTNSIYLEFYSSLLSKMKQYQK